MLSQSVYTCSYSKFLLCFEAQYNIITADMIIPQSFPAGQASCPCIQLHVCAQLAALNNRIKLFSHLDYTLSQLCIVEISSSQVDNVFMMIDRNKSEFIQQSYTLLELMIHKTMIYKAHCMT